MKYANENAETLHSLLTGNGESGGEHVSSTAGRDVCPMATGYAPNEAEERQYPRNSKTSCCKKCLLVNGPTGKKFKLKELLPQQYLYPLLVNTPPKMPTIAEEPTVVQAGNPKSVNDSVP